MSKRALGTWLILVTLVALVTACSSTTPSTTTEEQPVTEEVMMDEHDAGEAMTDDDKTDEETMDDDKADEKMTDDDKADEAMTDDDKTDEAMTDDDKADEEMMDDDKADEEMTVPDWFNVELTDVNTGETFRIADFQGKVVLLETMAVWCPSCTRQEQEVQALHEMLGERDDFVSVTLDVDPNESEDFLKAHIEQNDFDWYHAVSPREVNRELGNLYSVQYLNPPVMPMMIINQKGQVYSLPFGTIKKASNLKATLETHLNGE